MAMLRTLGWFTEILIGSLFAQLCDHAVQQFWAQHGSGGLLDGARIESPLIREGSNPVRSVEQLWAQLRSTVSEADALLAEFQRRAALRKGTRGSFSGCVGLLLSGSGESDEEELAARMRAVRRRLSELAGAVSEEAMAEARFPAESRELAIERRRHEAESNGFFRSLQESKKKDLVLGIAGVVLTCVWWARWIYENSLEIPRFSLIPSSLLEYLE